MLEKITYRVLQKAIRDIRKFKTLFGYAKNRKIYDYRLKLLVQQASYLGNGVANTIQRIHWNIVRVIV